MYHDARAAFNEKRVAAAAGLKRYDARGPCVPDGDRPILALDIRSDPPVTAGPATWDGHPKVPHWLEEGR